MPYSVFFFSNTRDAVLAGAEVLEGLPILQTRIPSALTGIDPTKRCTLGVVTKPEYRDDVIARLARHPEDGKHFDYQVFEVPDSVSDGLKPFVDMWDRCDCWQHKYPAKK